MVIVIAVACFPLTLLQPTVGVEASTLIYYVVAFGLSFWFAHRWRRRRLGESRYRWRVPSWPVAALVSVASVALLFGVVAPITACIPMSETMENMVRAMGTMRGWPTFLYFVIAAPVLEELIFRGIILDGLLKRYPTWTAIFVSSLLFGLVHMNLPQFITGFVLGGLMGWVYHRTSSVGACILIHMAANLSGYILRFFIGDDWGVRDVGVIESYGGWTLFLAQIGALIALFAACVGLLRREFASLDRSSAGEAQPA